MKWLPERARWIQTKQAALLDGFSCQTRSNNRQSEAPSQHSWGGGVGATRAFWGTFGLLSLIHV